MRILQINKFYYIEGGAERYFRNVSSLLTNHGHEIAFFSMQDPRNFPTKWSKYFVDFLSFQDVNYKDSIKIACRMIYSLEAKKKINQLLDIFHPEIVHIHNIYNHISPSILPEIKKRNIPIIQTVHDYHMLAPNRNLFHNGNICEITKQNSYYKSIIHKCVKNSYSASFLTALTMYIHRILGLYSKYIDYYITPSLFMKNKMIEYGFDNKKIIHLPNFIDTSSYSLLKKKERESKYILYCGRLSNEKGLLFLLEVAKKIPRIKFKLVGEGPQENTLKRYVKIYSLSNIEFLGYQTGKKLEKIILGSYLTIFPSLWHEPFGLSILESYALGKLVVASDIGGIPELVRNYDTGFLFIPNDVNDCIKKILTLWDNPKLVQRMGQNALKYAHKKFNAEEHYKKIINIYSNLIKKYKV